MYLSVRFGRAAIVLLSLMGALDPARAAVAAPRPPATPILAAITAVGAGGALGPTLLWQLDVGAPPLRLQRQPAGGAVIDALARSADGRRIAYVVDGQELWDMDADGQHARLLYSVANSAFLRLSGPRFTPDGGGIGFTAGCCGNFSIYRIDVGGTGLRRLQSGGVRFLQDWAPDGTHMLYTLDGKLWTADPRGGHPTPIGNDAADAGSFSDARYSPDNTHIVASLLPAQGTSEAEGRVLVLMHDNGEYLTILTGDLHYDASAATWSADGKRLAFIVASGTIGTQGRLHDLWAMRFNGRQKTNLTRNAPGDVTAAIWGR
jgi:Tol biopolymer transport system component